MSVSIVAVNRTSKKHLDVVVDEMESLGTPSIRAILVDNIWYAVEGSHRLAAAKLLGLGVTLIDITDDDAVVQFDGDDSVPMTADEILDWVTSDPMHSVIYNFCDDEITID